MKKKILNFILAILLSGSFCYAATSDSSNTRRLIGVTERTEIHNFERCDIHKEQEIITTKHYSDNTKTEYSTYNLLNPDGSIAMRNCRIITHHICDDVHYLIIDGSRLLFGTNTNYLNSQYSYNYLKPVYNETRIIAKKNNKYGLIDVKENTIIPFQYNNLIDLKDGSLKTQLGNKYGTLSIIDGKFLVPIMYDSLKSVSDNILIAQKDDKYGILSNSGTVIVPVNCDKIKSVKLFSPVYSVKRGELYGLADKYGRVLADIKYKKVKQKGDTLYVSIDGKNWELIDAVILK